MEEYTIEDLLFICNVVCNRVTYSAYEHEGMKKVILLLEKMEEMFNAVKEPED